MVLLCMACNQFLRKSSACDADDGFMARSSALCHFLECLNIIHWSSRPDATAIWRIRALRSGDFNPH
jgi:hypothetical protein